MTDLDIGLYTASETSGGHFHLDYDDCTEEEARADVCHLQDTFNLSDALLVESSPRHYHSIFFWDHMPWTKILEILDASKLVDPEFKESRKLQGFNRIRVDGSLKIIERMENRRFNTNPMGEFNYRIYQELIERLPNTPGR